MEENNSEAEKPKGMNWTVVVVVLLLLVGGGYYFMTSNSNTSDKMMVSDESNEVETIEINESMTTEDNTTVDDSSMMEGEVKVVSVEGGSFYFKPNTITVKAGEKVKVVLSAVDMMHDFVIDDLDVATKIAKSGETTEVEFTAADPGEYQFYCSVENHKAQGMVGTLVVEE